MIFRYIYINDCNSMGRNHHMISNDAGNLGVGGAGAELFAGRSCKVTKKGIAGKYCPKTSWNKLF